MVFSFGVCYAVLSAVSVENIFADFIIRIAVCTITVNALFFLCFFKTKEFSYLVNSLNNIFKIKEK